MKKFGYKFSRFDTIHQRDGQTDGRTPVNSKDRAMHIASRGKNCFYDTRVRGSYRILEDGGTSAKISL